MTFTRFAIYNREVIGYATDGLVYRIPRILHRAIGSPVGAVPPTDLTVDPTETVEV